MADATRDTREVKFRNPATALKLADALTVLCSEIDQELVTIMHVCGSHEQAIAKYGLRSKLPKKLDVIMGPGCPVCVTDAPEVDEGVALALEGIHITTYGDMIRVPGTQMSLADAQTAGGKVHVVYSASQTVEMARANPSEEFVFFATGFETTAVATAAVLLDDPPPNFSVLSAHKYVPPAMVAVAESPHTKLQGFLAAGHAATITGYGIFEPMAEKYGIPIVVAGFEPLDILAGLVQLVELVRNKEARVVNAYPRCVTREGNVNAQQLLWEVFTTSSGMWRGIADIPDGNLRLRDEYARFDARRKFAIDPQVYARAEANELTAKCICGNIMIGMSSPFDCSLFKGECNPDHPVGACMVSSEGTCKIWFEYGGRPDLGA